MPFIIELQQIIDGKLIKEGRERPNIQVLLKGIDFTFEFLLEDEERRFLIVATKEEETNVKTPESSPTKYGEEQQADILRRELKVLTEENQALKAEVNSL